MICTYIGTVKFTAGKSNGLSSNGSSSSNGQQSHQILCCAYNANGTVFVTGSSDTFARVRSNIHPLIKFIWFVYQNLAHLYWLLWLDILLDLFSRTMYLQVWSAFKCTQEDLDQPVPELDVLSGHENDVNYVQFRLVHPS